MLKAVGQVFSGLDVLTASTKVRMSPVQLRKAGVVIQNMQNENYNNDEINTVCLALFCQEQKDMEQCFAVFTKGGNDSLSDTDFRKVLPLMGEDVKEEDVAALFAGVDGDGNGVLDFEEFVLLVKGMNPSEDYEASLRERKMARALAQQHEIMRWRSEGASRIQAGVQKIKASHAYSLTLKLFAKMG